MVKKNRKSLPFRYGILSLIIVVFMLLTVGCIAPDSEQKISSNALDYLNQKYNEDFTIKGVKKEINEMDMFWRYTTTAVPKSHPELSIEVYSYKGAVPKLDNYKKVKWTADRKSEIINKIIPIIPNVIDSDIYFSDKDEEEHPVKDNALDLIKKYPMSISEDLTLLIKQDYTTIDKQKLLEGTAAIQTYYKDLGIPYTITLNITTRDSLVEKTVTKNGGTTVSYRAPDISVKVKNGDILDLNKINSFFQKKKSSK